MVVLHQLVPFFFDKRRRYAMLKEEEVGVRDRTLEEVRQMIEERITRYMEGDGSSNGQVVSALAALERDVESLAAR
jgi:hypothetical protein